MIHPSSNRRYTGTVTAKTVLEALSIDAAPPAGAPVIQILRPPQVYSRTNISVAVAMPIGPAYVASTLRSAGYPVSMIDAVGEGLTEVRPSLCGRLLVRGLAPDQIAARIKPETRILGISLMFSQEWPEHRELLGYLRRQRPDLTVVAGGEHATALTEETLRDGGVVDWVVRGEGEMAFLGFVAAFACGDDLAALPGVCHLGPDGQFINGGLAPRLAGIDDLPDPAWDLVDVAAYRRVPQSHGTAGGFHMPIVATRGCPYQCTFCSNPTMWTTRYVMRDATRVVAHAKELTDRYGAEGFIFTDLTALTRRDWILAFCDEVHRAGLTASWQMPSGTRSEALDPETLAALWKIGCRRLTYAPESGSAATLEVIKKRIHLDRMVESMKSAIAGGHSVAINLIVGFPHETRRDVLATVWFNLRMAMLGAQDGYPWVFSPYPGSELYHELRSSKDLPPPDDAYYASLFGVSDSFAAAGRSFCRLSLRELNLWRLAAAVLFYIIQYTVRPMRLFRFLRSAIGGNFVARSLFEQRIYEKSRAVLGRKQ